MISWADAQALPSGWTIKDVGLPPAPGSATFIAPAFTVTSRGSDVNGSSDQFTFVYRSIRGDATIIARVATVLGTDSRAQAGVMIRESLSTGSRHGFVFIRPSKGLSFHSRASIGGATTRTRGGSGKPPSWLKLERRSSLLRAWRSADGSNWTLIGSANVSMAQDVLVGLALTSYTTASNLVAIVSNVTVSGTSGAPPANVAPTVSLTAPAGGTTFTVPASVAMTAAAADSDGTVAKVDFYAGATLVGSDTTSPYAFTWTGVPGGTYAIKAVATDNRGAVTNSATANVTVTAAGNVAPTVSLTTPVNGASFPAPAAITLAATATDSDGTVQRVEFYAGATLLATDATSPYSFNWTNVAAGTYSVSAVATDNRGSRTVSAWRDITVTAGIVFSKAVFRPAVPPDDVIRYVLKVFLAGSDPDVAAPVATQDLGLPPAVGGECTVDVRSTILALAPGGYVATVSAVTGMEGTLRSNAFGFTR